MSNPSPKPAATAEEISRFEHLLCRSEDEHDEDPEALARLVDELVGRRIAVVMTTACEVEDFGGYSIWGMLHKTIRVGDHQLFAWSQRFTAEAVPPQRNFLAYYERDPGDLEANPERLDEIDGVVLESDAPSTLDEFLEAYEGEDDWDDDDDLDDDDAIDADEV